MTSSLVGSEMCIRDSSPTSLHILPRTTSPPRLPGGAYSRPPQSRRRHPVSYTHLTLPTICSV
eukprot:3887087-Prorocentrum_lima.AAC.1